MNFVGLAQIFRPTDEANRTQSGALRGIEGEKRAKKMRRLISKDLVRIVVALRLNPSQFLRSWE